MRQILIVALLAALLASAASHGSKHRRTTPSGRGHSSKHHHHQHGVGGKGHGGRTTTSKPGASPGSRPLPLPPQQKPSGPAVGHGACHVCVANGSVHLVAPDYNCSRYFSRGRLNSHVVTLNVCPRGQTFSSRTCSCGLPSAADLPCTCITRSGGGDVVTEQPKPGLTSTAATPLPTAANSFDKQLCSCLRNRARFFADWTSGCRHYFEDIGANQTKKHSCNSRQLFNVEKCACEYSEQTKCSCNSATVAPPSQPVNFTSCSAGGYTYRLIRASGCRNVTVESANFSPIMFTCPFSYYFNVRVCSCVSALRHAMHPICYDNTWSHTTQPTSQPVRTTSPAPPHVPGCQCVRHGNAYTPVNNCTAFEQVAPATGAHRFTCPAGLLFNVEACVCDRAENVRYCQTCGAQKPQVPPVRNGCQVCRASGNVYQQIPDTDCRQFSHGSATVAHRIQTCPGNQRFDPITCVCNHAEAVRCMCFSNSTGIQVTDTVGRATTGIASSGNVTHPNDRRSSSSVTEDGRCSCVTQGNVYRPIEKCRAFSQALVTTPSKVVRHQCPPGLLFDTASCVCTWPARTRCHDCAHL